MTVCAIVPAYNEAARVTAVLDAIAQAKRVDEIIVVDDGSSDSTRETAASHPAAGAGRLRAFRQEPNQGKGAAMRRGADETDADVLLFLDADLIGLTPAHVDALAAPVV